jgi:hypothetical protein
MGQFDQTSTQFDAVELYISAGCETQVSNIGMLSVAKELETLKKKHHVTVPIQFSSCL